MLSRRVQIALFLTWFIGYFAQWASGIDWARPLVVPASIVLILLLASAVLGDSPKGPPTP